MDLLAAIEDTAAHLEMPVVIEGYTPPYDPRIAADQGHARPGVIEVNVHPARNWQELVDNTTALYEDARQSRLGTEKFMLDGRHTGTGGGNHFVLGGRHAGRQSVPAPARSAAQHDRLLAESSVAVVPVFRHVHRAHQPGAARGRDARRTASTNWRSRSARFLTRSKARCPPWLVDRIFRHILVDVTGNTHRAEFCIDKLYSPDSATGRLGLLELRGFEMPPHARMSLTQQLLVRALIAWFWKEPYTRTRRSTGERACTISSCCRISSAQDFRDVLRRSERAPAIRSKPNGSRRISSSAIRCSATRITPASTSNCARPPSPGTCWAKKARRAAPRAMWIRRWSGCRSRWKA